MKKHHRHENDCLNCGTELQGHFCHVCGQENLQVKEPFWHFLSHSISHYFHFDEKFFSTLKPLLSQPGYLTQQYLAGKRTRFLQPVSMYIFVSIVYFLIVPHLHHKNSINQDDTGFGHIKINKKSVDSTSRDSIKAAIAKVNTLPFVPQKQKDKMLRKLEQALEKSNIVDFKTLGFARQTFVIDSLKALNKVKPVDSLQDKIEVLSDVHAEREDSTYQSYFNRQQKLPEDERDGMFDRFKKRRDIELKQKGFDLDKEVEHYQPKLYFILMPLFAFFLSLNFRKNHRYYVEHIVFTVHFFTAFFIFEIIVQPINYYVFKDNSWIFNCLIWGAVLWYSYTALRVFYNRPKWLTIRKMITLGILLSIAFGISYGIIESLVFITA